MTLCCQAGPASSSFTYKWYYITITISFFHKIPVGLVSIIFQAKGSVGLCDFKLVYGYTVQVNDPLSVYGGNSPSSVHIRPLNRPPGV